jgi:peptidase E
MRQIIAMGGGGFSMEPENLVLDRYVLEQTHKLKPKVCFLPTASGDALKGGLAAQDGAKTWLVSETS